MSAFNKFLNIFNKDKKIKYQITGICNKCGKCCENINLINNGKWIKSKNEFIKLTNEDNQFKRFTIIDKNYSGILIFKCSWLKENGLCKDYNNRLDICKKYPELEMLNNNGTIPDDCSYLKIIKNNQFEKILKKQIKKQKLKNFFRKLFSKNIIIL